MKSIVVYSCISGVIDSFKSEQVWGNADWFMYTDQNIISDWWEIKQLAYKDYKDTRRNSRMHKVSPDELFPGYDYSIWIDGSMRLNVAPETLIHRYLKDADIAVMTHPDRDCPYDEAEACIALKKDSPEIITEQMLRYRHLGFPKNRGLGETKIVIRKNNKLVNKFNQLWKKEIQENSLRDQLSFNFAAWSVGLRINYMPSWKETKDYTYYHHDKLNAS